MSNRKQTNYILKPYGIINNKQLRQNCQICQSKFQMLVNKDHTCKRCYRAICQKCGQNKIKIYHPQGHASVHKCCTICLKQQQTILEFIKRYKLVFGTSSLFADDWSKKLRKQNISSKQNINQQKANSNILITQFNEKIYQTNNNIIRFKSQSNQILNQLCASQNYSMRQFTGRMIQSVSTQLINQKIIQTMIAIYAYLKGIPYSYQLIYIVFFLLCFANEYDCYFIITRYIQKIFPQYFKIDKLKKDNLLSHQLKMILDMYKILLKKSDKLQLDKIINYLQKNFFISCIKSLLINITNITISFYLIDQIFKNSTYITLYKAITSLVFLSRELLYQQKINNNIISIQTNILKNITVQQIKSIIIIFEKSNIKFEMDHQFFDSAQHRKLHQKYKQLQNTYKKSQQRYRMLDIKYTTLLKDYQQIIIKLNEYKKQNISMTQQIIKNSQKFITIQDIDKYKQQNQILRKKNIFLIEKKQILEKQIQNYKKKQSIQNTQKNIFQRIKKDYQRQIVDLKTKNQIYQIQKQANDINFNTSFIQQKLENKNKIIAQLQDQCNKLKIQLDFYRNTRVSNIPSKQQNLFFNNVSNIQHKNSYTVNNNQTNNNTLNLSGFQIASKQDKDSFKRYIEMGKKVTQKLKSDLSSSQTRRQQLQKEVTKLNETISKLTKSMQLNEQINNFINQIPQDINYIDNIKQLQNIISKQSNIHKKGRLQTVLTSFRKCLYQVRYRSIDSKLKQNKIKQLYQNNNTSKIQTRQRQKTVSIESSGQKMLKEIQNIDQALDWIGKQSQLAQINRSSIKKQQCSIM